MTNGSSVGGRIAPQGTFDRNPPINCFRTFDRSHPNERSRTFGRDFIHVSDRRCRLQNLQCVRRRRCVLPDGGRLYAERRTRSRELRTVAVDMAWLVAAIALVAQDRRLGHQLKRRGYRTSSGKQKTYTCLYACPYTCLYT